VQTDSPIYAPRARRRRRSLSTPAAIAVVAGIGVVLAILVGLAFAGSRNELAAGTQVAGVGVGGLTKREAVAKLDALFEQRSDDPVEFVAGTDSYRLAANQLAVEPDWNAAVAAAGRSRPHAVSDAVRTSARTRSNSRLGTSRLSAAQPSRWGYEVVKMWRKATSRPGNGS